MRSGHGGAERIEWVAAAVLRAAEPSGRLGTGAAMRYARGVVLLSGTAVRARGQQDRGVLHDARPARGCREGNGPLSASTYGERVAHGGHERRSGAAGLHAARRCQALSRAGAGIARPARGRSVRAAAKVFQTDAYDYRPGAPLRGQLSAKTSKSVYAPFSPNSAYNLSSERAFRGTAVGVPFKL